MQIAITSQNRKSITEHAGQCRKFLIYDIEQQQIAARRLVELPATQSFHASPALPEALAGVAVLISRGMGRQLYQRLIGFGIQPLLTDETDPDAAIAGFLAGHLETRAPSGECHDHGTGHRHRQALLP